MRQDRQTIKELNLSTGSKISDVLEITSKREMQLFNLMSNWSRCVMIFTVFPKLMAAIFSNLRLPWKLKFNY